MHCKPFVLVVLAGCGSGFVERPTQVRYEPGSDDFWAMPLPSDERLQADGSYDLERFPGKRTALSAMWLKAADKRMRGGWSTTSGVFFTTSAAVDPATLTDESAYLLSLDDGARVPLSAREFTADAGSLRPANLVGLIPVLGFPRRPLTRYAAVLTDAVKDVSGVPLGRSAAFHDAFTRGDGFAPLRARAGAEHVVGATVFTTLDPSAQLRKLVEWEEAQPAPVASGFVAAETYPAFQVVVGAYTVPKLQSGERPGDGLIEWESDGVPRVSGEQRTRVVLSIPRTPMPAAGFPLMLYFHGSGGEAYEVIDRGPLPLTDPPPRPGTPPPGSGPAKYLAEAGIAALGFDFPLHGKRKDPPDTSGLELYDLFGDIDGTIDNMDIAAMEAVLVSRLAVGLRIPAGVSPLISGEVKFDPARLTVMGHSMGSTIAIPVASFDPRVRAFVFSGSGGSMIDVALSTTYPQTLKNFAELLLDFPADQHLWHGHPAVHAFQMLWDLTDPTNKAPFVTKGPRPGLQPKPYLQFAGQIDGYFHPLAQQSVIVPLGGQLVGEVVEPLHEAALKLDGRAVAAYPLKGNLNGVTAGVVQYATPFELGHYVVFDLDDCRAQWLCFVETVGARIVAPGAGCD